MQFLLNRFVLKPVLEMEQEARFKDRKEREKKRRREQEKKRRNEAAEDEKTKKRRREDEKRRRRGEEKKTRRNEDNRRAFQIFVGRGSPQVYIFRHLLMIIGGLRGWIGGAPRVIKSHFRKDFWWALKIVFAFLGRSGIDPGVIWDHF